MGPTFRIALPARYRRPALWGALVCSPTLLLLGSMGVAAATSPAVYEPVGVNAGDAEWLDTLTAPVAQGQGGQVVPLDPTSPVLPSGGDLQVLTITQGGGTADDVATVPAVPAVGDVTPTFRLSRSGIPVRVLQSYVAAAQMMARTDPGCRIHWSLVAGIGRVESNHGRFAGSGVTASGRVVPSILGPRLDGSRKGWATIRDSDNGAYDGDRAFDRAVGPMQFLPGTWKHFGADGDGDRRADPQDVDDAALGTARYLCAGGKDLTRRADRWSAVLRYNHSSSYAALVLGLADTYASGRAVPVPAPPAGVKPPKGETASPQRPPGPVTPVTPVPPAPLPSPSASASASPLPTSTLPGQRPTRPATGPTTGSPSPTVTTSPDPAPSTTAAADPGGPTTSSPAPDPTTAVPPTPTDPATTPPAPDPVSPSPQDTAPPPAPTTADPPPAPAGRPGPTGRD
ncbi:lytic transglycosylase domain-containing protein [Kineosporia sp. R_H_3]|uniref:lytic transglycosylase domain-containing protein n=1 Tax=Kineosporia sp. R_H_3 TaxID=1961848 RepID=UPI0018E91FFA|nr:lytic transglycosylase domain-containing protein [Kineosporia sp. R_H_3]